MPGSIVQIVGPGGASSAATSIVSSSITCTAGNQLWVIAISDDATISSITDSWSSGANTYTERGSVIEAAILRRLHHATCQIATGGTGTVTVNLGASVSNRQVWLVEVTGVGAYDAQGTATDTGNNPTDSASATNSAQPAFCVAAIVDYQGGTPTVGQISGSAATNGGSLAAGGQLGGLVEYRSVSTVTAQTANFGNAPFNRTCTVFAVFLEDSAPTISVHPADQTVNDGATATFSVTATGGATPYTYQWQDNSSGSFANVSGGSGATTATYTAPAAAYSHQGRLFRCVLNGTTNSNSAALRVAFNPTGAGPRAYPVLGGVIGAGSVESWLRGTDAGGGAGPVGTSTESDSALAMGRASPAGVCTTVDAALALAGVQIRAAGLAAESDQALALLPAANGAVGTAVESDVALARGVARPAGLAAESDAALALAGVAIRGVGAALEGNVAFALPARQVRAVGVAIESDAALVLNSTGGAAVGLASEIDVAVPRGVARPATPAAEANVALALVPLQVRGVGAAVEIDTAISLGGSAGTTVGLAAESDAAVARGSARPVGVSTESESALGLAARLIRQAGIAAQADVAFALAGIQRRDVGLASEVDGALQLFRPGALPVGMAVETNAAFAILAAVTPTWPGGGTARIGGSPLVDGNDRLGSGTLGSGGKRLGGSPLPSRTRRIG